MLWKCIKDDYRRIFYIKHRYKLPYNEYFFYKSSFRFINACIGYKFFIYTGKIWLKVIINQWRVGFSIKLFCWCKKIAIFKKRLLLKKKKKNR